MENTVLCVTYKILYVLYTTSLACTRTQSFKLDLTHFNEKIVQVMFINHTCSLADLLLTL